MWHHDVGASAWLLALLGLHTLVLLMGIGLILVTSSCAGADARQGASHGTAADRGPREREADAGRPHLVPTVDGAGPPDDVTAADVAAVPPPARARAPTD